MTKTFAENVVEFNRTLRYDGELPRGFQVMNPYLDNPETLQVMQEFYTKYYNDTRKRKFLIGINPSRHGAGVTGVPFTDTKRLEAVCGIPMQSAHTHEISSVFIYDMIAAYGGAEAFYRDVYINSPFPLAIIRKPPNGSWRNANYYDEKELFEMVRDYMITSMKRHIAMGLDTSNVFVMGKKNATFIDQLNKQEKLFERMTVLEHPRYIQQYKTKDRDMYIAKYIAALKA